MTIRMKAMMLNPAIVKEMIAHALEHRGLVEILWFKVLMNPNCSNNLRDHEVDQRK
jgi:hypothetical protein